MESNVHMADKADNVGIVIQDIEAGDAVIVSADVQLTARKPIPRYHKAALVHIGKGSPIIKYGENIGHAKEDIQPGDHVHIHNMGA
jgi:altronate dehydratase